MEDKKSNAAPQKNESDVLALNQTIQQLEKSAEEYLNGWKRAQADYQNLQKETAKVREEFSQFATEGLLRELLPLVDYFDFAFRRLPEGLEKSEWFTGIQHIYKELMQVLERHGVRVMNTAGETFDPQFHEAIEEVEAEGESGSIAEEVQKGFLLHGKVLRPARVKIIS